MHVYIYIYQIISVHSYVLVHIQVRKLEWFIPDLALLNLLKQILNVGVYIYICIYVYTHILNCLWYICIEWGILFLCFGAHSDAETRTNHSRPCAVGFVEGDVGLWALRPHHRPESYVSVCVYIYTCTRTNILVHSDTYSTQSSSCTRRLWSWIVMCTYLYLYMYSADMRKYMYTCRPMYIYVHVHVYIFVHSLNQ